MFGVEFWALCVLCSMLILLRCPVFDVRLLLLAARCWLLGVQCSIVVVGRSVFGVYSVFVVGCLLLAAGCWLLGVRLLAFCV